MPRAHLLTKPWFYLTWVLCHCQILSQVGNDSSAWEKDAVWAREKIRKKNWMRNDRKKESVRIILNGKINTDADNII